ncbi:MAG TPA: ABC transporter permease [Bryobacteraceae bacterium]|nr:ABC transporter permease [Bryobacteraceae bacterium]
MSTLAMPAPRTKGSQLWRTQAASIFAVELRKNFITKRGFWIYLLALLPVAIVWLHSFVTMRGGEIGSHPLNKDTEILAGLFLAFFLRPAVFFGCVGIFTYLFRGEVVERTLHYYFLAPVKREVLVAGKYLAGLVTAVFFFCGSIALIFAGMYAHYPSHELRAFLFDGPGVGHLLAYLSITALGCMAYGALFTWMGVRYKNPIIPAVLLLAWESANILLPGWLKIISILYYLRSMTPVDPGFHSEGALIGGVVDPVSGPVAVVSLFSISAGLLFMASRDLRRSEVSYSSD